MDNSISNIYNLISTKVHNFPKNDYSKCTNNSFNFAFEIQIKKFIFLIQVFTFSVSWEPSCKEGPGSSKNSSAVSRKHKIFQTLPNHI
jgi:hypothetical protein